MNYGYKLKSKSTGISDSQTQELNTSHSQVYKLAFTNGPKCAIDMCQLC